MPTLPSDDPVADDVAPSAEEHYSRGAGQAAGLEAGQVEQLESFGLVTPALEIGGEPVRRGHARGAAAAGFFARGGGAHLRMYRTFAEREAVPSVRCSC